MKFSVALCTYNGEKFLREQLASIACQSHLPAELVACDDRSKDGTLDILIHFQKKAPFPVHIYQNDFTLGSTKNFEKAINLCSGEIIALCDQDDSWKPHKLERLEKEFIKHPEAGYIFSDAELVDVNLQPLDKHLWESIGFNKKFRGCFQNEDQFLCLLGHGNSIVTGATMAFRAQIGRLAIPFPTGGYLIHDGWLALVSTAAGLPGVPIDESLICYRQHSRQQVGAFKKERQSLPAMYRNLKFSKKRLFAAWEQNCLQILKLKDILKNLQQSQRSEKCETNIRTLCELERHYQNRREIFSSNALKKYRLIFQEVISGRYKTFSDSWRTIVRDAFL